MMTDQRLDTAVAYGTHQFCGFVQGGGHRLLEQEQVE